MLSNQRTKNPRGVGHDNTLWGVVVCMAKGSEEHIVMASDALVLCVPRYPGEPLHALLFDTRARARAWCIARNKLHHVDKRFPPGWKFKTVPIRETLTILKGGRSYVDKLKERTGGNRP